MTGPHKTAAELFSEIPAPRDTREKILFTALDLFHAHGFHAIGLDRILDAVGVTKTTFYNHFESRDALIVEAIKIRDKWDQAAFDRRLRELGGYAPRELLLGMFDVLHEWFTDTAFRGCIFVHACAEFPSRNDPVHRAAQRHFLVADETIQKIAAAAGARDPAGLAATWSLLLQGAIIRRMTAGVDHSAITAKQIAERILDQELSAG